MAAPIILRLPYELLCGLIDLLFEDRPLARFWFLETVARMPYFSYISMLHLYESLGWWRRSAEIKRVHFAEEWNVRSYNKNFATRPPRPFWLQLRCSALRSALRIQCLHSTITFTAPNAHICSRELLNNFLSTKRSFTTCSSWRASAATSAGPTASGHSTRR